MSDASYTEYDTDAPCVVSSPDLAAIRARAAFYQREATRAFYAYDTIALLAEVDRQAAEISRLEAFKADLRLCVFCKGLIDATNSYGHDCSTEADNDELIESYRSAMQVLEEQNARLRAAFQDEDLAGGMP